MTSESSSTQRILKIFMVVALLGLAVLLFTSRSELAKTIDVLREADLKLVLLIPLVQALSYLFLGLYYRFMFGNFGAHITVPRSWAVVSALQFVNLILPSGGVSGISYLAYGFRARLSSARTTLVQVGRYVFSFWSYILLVPVVVWLLTQGDNSQTLKEVANQAGGDVRTLIVGGAFAFIVLMVIVVVSWRSVANRLAGTIADAINWFGHKIMRRTKTLVKRKTLIDAADDFHDGIGDLLKQRTKIIGPALAMLGSTICEVAIVVIASRAVGIDAPIAAIFISFVVANMVGIISIIPGDVGVHEAAVILMLSAFGVEPAAAISAALLYRVFNKMIFLPVGFFFYTRLLKPAVAGKAG